MRGREQSCWSESRPSGPATGGREMERGRERRWRLQTRIREDEAPHQQPTPSHPLQLMGVHAVSLAVELVHWPAPSISTLRRSAASSLFRAAKTQDACAAARYFEENTFFVFTLGPRPSTLDPKVQFM